MSLRFIDGFDHYSFAQILRIWTATNGTHAIGTSGTRFGAGSILTFATGVGTHISKTLDNQATWIVGFAAKFPSFPVSARPTLISFNDGASTQVAIAFTGNGRNNLEVTRNISGSTVLGTSTLGIPFDTWCYVEVKVTISDTVGVVTIKINDVTILNLTGQDTKNSANAFASMIRFNGDLSGTSGTAIAWLIDDIYICDGTTGGGGVVPNDDFLGDNKVEILLPNGAGNYSQFSRGGADSGNNYGQVDENPANDDTDYVYSSTINQIDTYNFDNLSSTPIGIFGIELDNLVKKDNATAREFTPVVRLGSTDYLLTTDAVSTSYQYDTQIKEISPATSAAWTSSEINAAEFGYKVIS